MKRVTHLALVGILAAASMALTACSDEQVALGAGVVIGAVIADGHHHHHYPRPRYRPPHRHYRPRPRYFDAQADLSNATKAAMHFSVSVEAGEKIMHALERAEQKDFAAIAELGIQRADMEALANGENPSASTLVDLSRNLGLDFDQTHNVIQVMKRDLADGMNGGMNN